MLLIKSAIIICLSGLMLLLYTNIAAAQIRLPAIDPSGNRIFLPNANTTLLTPNSAAQNALTNPLRQGTVGSGVFPQQGFGTNFQQSPVPRPPARLNPFGNVSTPRNIGRVGPAFTQPPRTPLCGRSGCVEDQKQSKKHFVPNMDERKTAGQQGEILMSPARIIAPVGSEVVVITGICGGDGYLSTNQPLEWMLSNDSVGQLIEVGGMHHSNFNRLVPPEAKKFDGQYAWGRTGLKRVVLTRGTPTPCDDIELAKGQTFVSVSSASAGTTYVTGVAPKAEGWDRRRATTVIQWVDALWATPTPSKATAGTVYPLTTVVNRSTDGKGVQDWKVKYTIVGGAPAEFAPAGSNTALATTDEQGRGIAQIRQPAGRFEPGVTQVRVDIVRPAFGNEPELVVESGLTTVTWSAPALTIRAVGPKAADLDQPFNYRVAVTNPGDQVARGVVVRTKDLDDSLEYISSTPKPVEFGRQLEWTLGDIAPGSPPQIIDVQLKSNRRGNAGLCFEVASDSDRLRTEACSQTEISAPCLALAIDGPSAARVGDDVVYKFIVENQCDETIEDIKLTVAYDPGLYADGRTNPVVTRINELNFGQKREVSLAFNVQQPGTQCIKLNVTTSGGEAFEAGKCLDASNATQPDVMFDVEGQSPITVGETAQVNARIRNTGNTPIDSVVLTNKFSDSLEAVRATEDFQFTRISDNEYAFAIGRIEPGEEKLLEVEYLGLKPDGNATSEFALTSTSNINATRGFDIRIEPNSTSNGAGPGFADPDVGPIRPGTVGPGASPRVTPEGNPQFDLDDGSRAGDDNPLRDPDAIVQPDRGVVGIPRDDSLLANEVLDVQVKTVTSAIRARNSNEQLPEDGIIEFSVTNRGSRELQDVAVSFLVPPGLQFKDYRSLDNNLVIENSNGNVYDFGLRRSMRPGDTLSFAIRVNGTQGGRPVVEVGAAARGLEGDSQSSDFISVAP